MVEPAFHQYGVVVEKIDVLSNRLGRAAIAAAGKAAVLRIAESFDEVRALREKLRCLVARTIVDDDDFEGGAGAHPEDRVEALRCELALVEDGNDDGNERLRRL